MGEGTPYKVEGIGGDKIPTHDLVRLHRRVAPGVRQGRRWPWPAASRPRGGDPRRRLGRAQRRSSRSTSRASSTIPTRCVVTILCDTGERYLSKLFNDEWMQENQLLDTPQLTVGELLAQRHDRRARRS